MSLGRSLACGGVLDSARSGRYVPRPSRSERRMRLGVTLYIQDYPDWERFGALERGEEVPALDPNADAAIWDEEMEAALQAEEQGFDSLWVVEHHVSPYTMITDPIQALS